MAVRSAGYTLFRLVDDFQDLKVVIWQSGNRFYGLLTVDCCLEVFGISYFKFAVDDMVHSRCLQTFKNASKEM